MTNDANTVNFNLETLDAVALPTCIASVATDGMRKCAPRLCAAIHMGLRREFARRAAGGTRPPEKIQLPPLGSEADTAGLACVLLCQAAIAFGQAVGETGYRTFRPMAGFYQAIATAISAASAS